MNKKGFITRFSALFMILAMLLSIVPVSSMDAEAASVAGLVNMGVGSARNDAIPAPFNKAQQCLYAKILHADNAYIVTYCLGFGEHLYAGTDVSKTDKPVNSTQSGGLSDSSKVLIGYIYAAGLNGEYDTKVKALNAINANATDYVATQVLLWVAAHGYYDKAAKRNKIVNHLTKNLKNKAEIKKKITEIRKKVTSYQKEVSFPDKNPKTLPLDTTDTTKKSFKKVFSDKNNAYATTTYSITKKSSNTSSASVSGNNKKKVTVKLKVKNKEKTATETVTCTRTIKFASPTFYQGTINGAPSQALVKGSDLVKKKNFKVTTKKDNIPNIPDTPPTNPDKFQVNLQKAVEGYGTIEGIEFTLTYPSGDTSTKKTDNRGMISWTDLTESGTYTVAEGSEDEEFSGSSISGNDFVKDGAQSYTVSLGNDGKTFTWEPKFTNKRKTISLNLRKTLVQPAYGNQYSIKGIKYVLWSLPSDGNKDDGYDPLDEDAIWAKKDQWSTECTLTTDENGEASADNIIYSESKTYFLKESEAPEGINVSDDLFLFDDVLDPESNSVKYSVDVSAVDYVNRVPFVIQKVDEDTNEPVSIEGFKFQILDENKKPIKTSTTTETGNDTVEGNEVLSDTAKEAGIVPAAESPDATDVFETDENGMIVFQNGLPYGKYYIKEIEAPSPYLVNTELKEFTVQDSEKMKSETFTSDKNTWIVDDDNCATETKYDKAAVDKAVADVMVDEEGNTIPYFTFTFKDVRQRGSLEIYKYGNFFSSVQTDNDGTQKPVFSYDYLKDAVFKVYKGDYDKNSNPVATITTDENGLAELKGLELGRYTIVEEQAPDGYNVLTDPDKIIAEDEEDRTIKKEVNAEGKEVNDDFDGAETYEVELVHDQDKKSVKASLDRINESAYLGISLLKKFDKGDGSMEDVSFGLFAGEDFTATDGSKIMKDTQIDTITLDDSGKGSYVGQLPYGKYYIEETSTADGYEMDSTRYEIDFYYDGTNRIDISLNNGEAIINYKEDETISYSKTSSSEEAEEEEETIILSKSKTKNPKTTVKTSVKKKTVTEHGQPVVRTTSITETGDKSPLVPVVFLFLFASAGIGWLMTREQTIKQKK